MVVMQKFGFNLDIFEYPSTMDYIKSGFTPISY